MRNIESFVREADSSMAMEGMSLYFEDKERIRKWLEDLGNPEKIVASLVEMHTVSTQK